MTTTADQTAPLYLARARIDVPRFSEWARERNEHDTAHGFHSLFTELFGELAPRPYRVKMPTNGKHGTLYGYTRCRAEELQRSAADFGEPLQLTVVPPDHIMTKLMPDHWIEGRQMGFEIRVRPTVRYNQQGDVGREIETDAFSRYVELHPELAKTADRGEVYTEWLCRRLENDDAVSVDRAQTRLAGVEYVSAKLSARARSFKAPQAVINGVLTIRDGSKFQELLARGCGRHRAFGFGMLLLRPLQSAR